MDLLKKKLYKLYNHKLIMYYEGLDTTMVDREIEILENSIKQLQLNS